MSRTITEQLAQSIERWIADDQLVEGTPLPERAVAERFRVSRTPVRDALQRLAQQGTLVLRPEGGYAVKAQIELPILPANAFQFGSDDDEAIYHRIARDRLENVLPERVTENELMRRYELTRARLANILRRVTNEGWIERLPGKGWCFLPVLSTGAAYDQGYRLRILLEPAALLEPTWRLDRAALTRCREQQQALVDGAVEWASPAQLFDANATLHEAIAACSGNALLCDSLKRVNRLRRLMEYARTVDRQSAAQRCREHLTLIDLLLSDQRETAADFLRLHLRDAAREKAVALSGGAQ